MLGHPPRDAFVETETCLAQQLPMLLQSSQRDKRCLCIIQQRDRTIMHIEQRTRILHNLLKDIDQLLRLPFDRCGRIYSLTIMNKSYIGGHKDPLYFFVLAGMESSFVTG